MSPTQSWLFGVMGGGGVIWKVKTRSAKGGVEVGGVGDGRGRGCSGKSKPEVPRGVGDGRGRGCSGKSKPKVPRSA